MEIPGWMLIPFAVMLLCIAVLPLLPKVGEWWEENTHKLIVSVILGAPVGIWMVMNGGAQEFEHTMIYDYVPFILLLMALFTTTGGINIKGDLKATPIVNTAIMAIGWALASFMGTTGAAMLMIRPIMKNISERKYKTHTMLFFIAIVANCGGLLSPLGDPPLFLLFQKGAPFAWWMQNMIGEWLVTGLLLLIVYFITDTYFYKKEPKECIEADKKNYEKVSVRGYINIFWLLCVIASTMFINKTYIPGMEQLVDKVVDGKVIQENIAPWYLRLLREWVFIAIILASWFTTKKQIRIENNYSWTPILEVACVFVGIFATMAPALLFLGSAEVSKFLNEYVTHAWEYVYSTGLLSSFLDNAPTAMVFNSMAVGSGHVMEGIPGLADAEFLKAISMGAVFFGSMTYIGNGPNFMVKSIAEQNKIDMPSFFGYMIKFSLVVLLPIFIITQLIFI